MDVNKGVQDILQEAKAQIVANMQSKGVNASGRTSRNFEVRQRQGGWLLLLNDANTPRAPLGTLEVGRAGGSVPRGFYYIIRKWTEEKGLQFDTERERGTFAYFVARKIAREGTTRHRAPIDIYTTPAKQASEKIKGVFSRFVSLSLRQRAKK